MRVRGVAASLRHKVESRPPPFPEQSPETVEQLAVRHQLAIGTAYLPNGSLIVPELADVVEPRFRRHDDRRMPSRKDGDVREKPRHAAVAVEERMNSAG